MNPYALLVDSAPAGLQTALLERLDHSSRRFLLGGMLAPGAFLLAHVPEHGSSADRAALAGNLELAPETYLRLAEKADHAVARRLFDNLNASREVRVLAAEFLCRDELLPRRVPDGLLERAVVAGQIGVLVGYEDAALVAAAMAYIDPADNPLGAPPLILRGCLGLLRAAGPDAVANALAGVPPLRGKQPDAVSEGMAAPTDESVLTDVLGRLGGTPHLVDGFRSGGASRKLQLMLAAPRGPLDWALVLREHAREPLNLNATSALAKEVGCPERIREAAAWPTSVRPRTAQSRLNPRAERKRLLYALAQLTPRPDPEFRAAYHHGVLSAPDILAHAAPAAAALVVFERTDPRRYPAVRSALASLTARSLGTDIEAWTVALSLLREFAGTVPELLASAASITA
ncbi:hypothetical protein OG216_20485 [Streptomycetaceae bacterium NBC_01309]